MNIKEQQEQLHRGISNFCKAISQNFEKMAKEVEEMKLKLDILPKPELDLMEEAAHAHDAAMYATKIKMDIYETYIQALKNQEVVEQRIDLHNQRQTWHRVNKMPDLLSFDPNKFRLASPLVQPWGLLKVAFREGKEIEYRLKGANQDWSLCVNPIWDNDQIEYRLKEDPYAEFKKAYDEGKTIQFFCAGVEGKYAWIDIEKKPFFARPPEKYRIKPEEPPREPKVGDVCKFHDNDPTKFLVAVLDYVNFDSKHAYRTAMQLAFKNAHKLTEEEANDLLFGKGAQSE